MGRAKMSKKGCKEVKSFPQSVKHSKCSNIGSKILFDHVLDNYLKAQHLIVMRSIKHVRHSIIIVW